MISGTVPNILLLGSAHARARDVYDHLYERGVPAHRSELTPCPTSQVLRAADLLVCVLDPHAPTSDVGHVETLLASAREERIAALVWGVPDNFEQPGGELIECLRADVGLEEVIGRLTAMARFAPTLKQMERELERLQRLGHHLNRYFEEVDQELRLAGRLQRDFMPRELPTIGPLTFTRLFRPAGWVSGDIYDVFPIDRTHVGMFIADAMGHGTAAGLMTMFLRRALVPTRVLEDRVCLVPPAVAMEQLHEELARQDLPNAQFVTAAYAVLDCETLEIRLARGGHPYPLHVNAAGEIHELRSEGGLLGVAGLKLEFDEHRGRLAAGDKVIFYTDGLESLFMHDRDPRTGVPEFTDQLCGWTRLRADDCVAAIAEHLDHQEGSLNPEDDITVVVAEVAL